MIRKPAQWPSSSGVFNVPTTVVMSSAPIDDVRRGADTMFVATPLDLIRILEDRQGGLVTVVLTGRFAADNDMAMFLRETYPAIQVVVERPRSEVAEQPYATIRTSLVA